MLIQLELPVSCLRALKLEDANHGKVYVKGNSIVYADSNSKVVREWPYRDKREANLQLSFFRVIFNDQKEVLKSLRVIPGGIQ